MSDFFFFRFTSETVIYKISEQSSTRSYVRIFSHDNLRFRHTACDGLVRQNLAPVYVDLVLDDDVFPQDGAILHAHPLPHDTAPADDAALQPGMRFDDSVREDGAPPDANPVLYDNAWPYGDVRSYPTADSYLSSWVYQNVADDSVPGT